VIKADKQTDRQTDRPLASCTQPTRMMMMRASTLAMVKTYWTRLVQLTLQQLMNVSNTNDIQQSVTHLTNNNNNNNNKHDIYSAVIMTEVIARVHSVHLVNVKQWQAAADPQTKPPDLGCESACFGQLSSTTTIAIYYYYSAGKLMSHGG